MGVMLDTTSADLVQTFKGLHFDAVAAYGNGRYANYPVALKEFAHLHLLEIDVANKNIGHAGDFEPGCMAYGEAGAWATKRIEAGVKRPVLYFQASEWDEVMKSLAAVGVPRSKVRIWTAHYTGKEHRCSHECGYGITGADATQWATSDHPQTLPRMYAGHHIDVSLTSNTFWD